MFGLTNFDRRMTLLAFDDAALMHAESFVGDLTGRIHDTNPVWNLS